MAFCEICVQSVGYELCGVDCRLVFFELCLVFYVGLGGGGFWGCFEGFCYFFCYFVDEVVWLVGEGFL